MLEIDFTAGELINALMHIADEDRVCVLDSCGVGHLGSHLLIAGMRPVKVVEVRESDPDETLRLIDELLAEGLAAIFTLSYDFGEKLQRVSNDKPASDEPDVFIALFDRLIIHDYDTSKTYVAGNLEGCNELIAVLDSRRSTTVSELPVPNTARSNFSREGYLESVENIREYIRRGDTYQTNLTQQLTCRLDARESAAGIFQRLRENHPAPFASFMKRHDSTVVSASPERFFRVMRDRSIEASPIKGTRPRSGDPAEDDRLRDELRASEKDRAENTMIVDLMRNDLGRVCEYGSVHVTKLCDLEEHPTLFHLVSTVTGKLRTDAKFTEIIRALFPCGSITGAPKIRTMQLIGEIEPSRRGLSMGAIGIYLPESWSFAPLGLHTVFDLSVAIRTLVIRDGEAIFNVGGGIVIDSDPEKEYDESMLKAQALLTALGSIVK